VVYTLAGLLALALLPLGWPARFLCFCLVPLSAPTVCGLTHKAIARRVKADSAYECWPEEGHFSLPTVETTGGDRVE
jgi:hypothetical protein